VKLDLGGSVYGPTDPVGRLLFNIVAMVAEFESDLIRLRTREGMKVAEAKGHLRGKQPKLNHRQEGPSLALLDTGEYTTAEVADCSASAAPLSIAPSNESEHGRYSATDLATGT
jgi:DNA invertase Pin-like site-specific DNA recombinase